ncbi:PREDICTED: uncharacterized protein LOC109113893 [Nelumbo nucifera]|uniref:Uncharacterized protein LOC109113893 n=1 Tax=Nelumbo nucifera TaxID=4432 RepID=A0A1U8QC74_NELNU|nr:PREDICTED: uncharacterized protein LOC109113893 [Nelumbo nucifera]XP_019055797.1 PREDICTED: uncharacterized protein LOC109113893 [Nelumbo nucifera]
MWVGFIGRFSLFFLFSLFRRENSTGEPDFTGKPFASPSKELLYFFCWKNQSRIEPAVPPTSLASDAQDATPELVDPLKWHGLYGPSRVLFTIKEEREDAESQKSSAERKPKKRQSLEECFEVTNSEELEEMVKVEVEVERGTPFTTPCGSPPYYLIKLLLIGDSGLLASMVRVLRL